MSDNTSEVISGTPVPTIAGVVQNIKAELTHCEGEKYLAAAVPCQELRFLLDSFDKQQSDLEQLVKAYVTLLDKAGKLQFWSTVLVQTIRPAKKQRAYVAEEAATKLKEAVRAYAISDGMARMNEEAKVIQEPATEPIQSVNQTTTDDAVEASEVVKSKQVVE